VNGLQTASSAQKAQLDQKAEASHFGSGLKNQSRYGLG
jgi:hypothetical protein